MQELAIRCTEAYGEDEGQPGFNTAPLGALPRLRRLTLERFSEFHLGGLPASLRTLRCTGTWMFDDDSWPSLQALALPAACR